mmetsp:Transcript_55822/g.168798  ORF Transcript_55822/g.168798 Transcript_55822/m.168798 type:complete len:248 (-) Transcript_55822:160-903(-)
MGDGGLCTGAAALACRELELQVSCPRGNCLLGPEFHAEQVREALRLALASAGAAAALQEPGALARAVAAELHAGRVVGVFFGAMEFGPRALGHRSLLARATDLDIGPALNARLRRTEFMPFAPVTLRAHAGEAYVGWDPGHMEACRHMTMCYGVTPGMRALCPAIVHVDGTARPQVVDEHDGLYFEILREYELLSGIHSLVNTSFNAHEEPIVCGPQDALAAFKRGACDVLAMPPYLVIPTTQGNST